MKSCKDCEYVEKVGNSYECRRNPPGFMLAKSLVDENGEVLYVYRTGFPVVDESEPCGEYKQSYKSRIGIDGAANN